MVSPAGTVKLDSGGNVLCDASGNVELSGGSNDKCNCCGGSLGCVCVACGDCCYSTASTASASWDYTTSTSDPGWSWNLLTVPQATVVGYANALLQSKTLSGIPWVGLGTGWQSLVAGLLVSVAPTCSGATPSWAVGYGYNDSGTLGYKSYFVTTVTGVGVCNGLVSGNLTIEYKYFLDPFNNATLTVTIPFTITIDNHGCCGCPCTSWPMTSGGFPCSGLKYQYNVAFTMRRRFYYTGCPIPSGSVPYADCPESFNVTLTATTDSCNWTGSYTGSVVCPDGTLSGTVYLYLVGCQWHCTISAYSAAGNQTTPATLPTGAYDDVSLCIVLVPFPANVTILFEITGIVVS